MLDVALIAKTYDTVEEHLPAARVTVKIKGKEFIALLPTETLQSFTTMVGIDPGFKGTLYIKNSRIRPKRIESGDKVELKAGSRWITVRAKSPQTVAETITVVELESEQVGI